MEDELFSTENVEERAPLNGVTGRFVGVAVAQLDLLAVDASRLADVSTNA